MQRLDKKEFILQDYSNFISFKFVYDQAHGHANLFLSHSRGDTKQHSHFLSVRFSMFMLNVGLNSTEFIVGSAKFILSHKTSLELYSFLTKNGVPCTHIDKPLVVKNEVDAGSSFLKLLGCSTTKLSYS